MFHGVSRRLVTQVDTRVTALPGRCVRSPEPAGVARRRPVRDHQQRRTALRVRGGHGRRRRRGRPAKTGPGRAWRGPVDPHRRRQHLSAAVVDDQPRPRCGRSQGELRRRGRGRARGPISSTARLPNPITSNVVLLKAQYGIDSDGNNTIDTWVSARNAPWTAADVLGAPIAQLRQIKAVRIAMVVRSSQFERSRDAEGRVVAGGAIGAAIPRTRRCSRATACPAAPARWPR